MGSGSRVLGFKPIGSRAQGWRLRVSRVQVGGQGLRVGGLGLKVGGQGFRVRIYRCNRVHACLERTYGRRQHAHPQGAMTVGRLTPATRNGMRSPPRRAPCFLSAKGGGSGLGCVWRGDTTVDQREISINFFSTFILQLFGLSERRQTG